jgi:hypothetical protein
MVRNFKVILNRSCFLGVFAIIAMIDDFFSVRQDQIIDLRHPLAALVNRMPFQRVQNVVRDA